MAGDAGEAPAGRARGTGPPAAAPAGRARGRGLVRRRRRRREARPGAPLLLLATDTVVAGMDADLSLTTLSDLGWKAMAVNLSDIAAMGGTPATPW